MKIVTWNINGVRAAAKKGLQSFIDSTAADVYCFQEMKAHPDQVQENWMGEGRNYQTFWSACERPGYSSVAILTEKKPKSVEYGIGIHKFDVEGRFVIADFGNFLLYNVYFPNGGNGQERHDFKQEFLREFLFELTRQIRKGREIIVVGDYNVAPENIDVYDPQKLGTVSGFLPEERVWFNDFLNVGFVDMFRKFNPKEPNKFTWWSYQEQGRLGNRGWRIDHVCATQKIAQKFRNCVILDSIEGSDHCPVFAELTD